MSNQTVKRLARAAARVRTLGTSWIIVGDMVRVYMVTLGRDAYSVAHRVRHGDGWSFDARESSPDDILEDDPIDTPEVPEDLVTVSVPLERFAQFLWLVSESDDEDHLIFPTVAAAWASERGETEYEDTPWGRRLTRRREKAVEHATRAS